MKDREIFWLSLSGCRVWLRTCHAFSGMDMWTEILGDGEHLLVPGLSGDGADPAFHLGADEDFYTFKARESYPQCKAIAVELYPLAFEVLERNITSKRVGRCHSGEQGCLR